MNANVVTISTISKYSILQFYISCITKKLSFNQREGVQTLETYPTVENKAIIMKVDRR